MVSSNENSACILLTDKHMHYILSSFTLVLISWNISYSSYILEFASFSLKTGELLRMVKITDPGVQISDSNLGSVHVT